MTAHVTMLQAASMEGRYRLLVDAITDYAIYCSMPKVTFQAGMRVLSASRAIPSRKSSASIFPASIRRKTLPPAFRRGLFRRPKRKDDSRRRGGVFERMASVFGTMSSLMRSAINTANCLASPRSPATFQRERLPRRF
jgi:hypothetical protein